MAEIYEKIYLGVRDKQSMHAANDLKSGLYITYASLLKPLPAPQLQKEVRKKAVKYTTSI